MHFPFRQKKLCQKDCDLGNVVLVLVAMLVSGGCSQMHSVSPLAAVERKLIYHPEAMPPSVQLPAGCGIQDAHFAAPDGTKLHGWFYPHRDPRAVALLMHGNAGNISGRIETLKLLNERHQLSVMIFDYRGFGHSEGKPDEPGILMDARAARDWLAVQTATAPADIVLMGRSLGGGVAVDLAANDGARGLVLASTFPSLPRVGRHHFPWVPTGILMTQRLNSVAKIDRYHGPLLQSHGDADQVIPFVLGKELFDSANQPKQFVTIKGGGHNDPQTEAYRLALDQFIDELPPSPDSDL